MYVHESHEHAVSYVRSDAFLVKMTFYPCDLR